MRDFKRNHYQYGLAVERSNVSNITIGNVIAMLNVLYGACAIISPRTALTIQRRLLLGKSAPWANSPADQFRAFRWFGVVYLALSLLFLGHFLSLLWRGNR
jgi:hypothetical protein